MDNAKQEVLHKIDAQDVATLDELQNGQMVDVFYEFDPTTGRVTFDAQGNTVLIAYEVTINGVKTVVPANKHVSIPAAVYEVIEQLPYQSRAVASPFQRLNELGYPIGGPTGEVYGDFKKEMTRFV